MPWQPNGTLMFKPKQKSVAQVLSTFTSMVEELKLVKSYNENKAAETHSQITALEVQYDFEVAEAAKADAAISKINSFLN